MSVNPGLGLAAFCFLLLGFGFSFVLGNDLAPADQDGMVQNSGIVKGKIRDRHGKPLREVRVRLIRSEDASIYFSDPVDKEGRYKVKALPEGKFAVHVIWLGSGNVYPWGQGFTLGKGETKDHNIWVKPVLPGDRRLK